MNAEERPAKRKSPWGMSGVIIAGLALIGAGLGLISLFRQETKAFSASALTIGLSAVVVQWMVVVAMAIIGLLILYLIFAFFTGGEI